jgi:hypothetical protein
MSPAGEFPHKFSYLLSDGIEMPRSLWKFLEDKERDDKEISSL